MEDRLLPIIIVIAQNSFDLLITDINFVIYLLSRINCRDKRFFIYTAFKVCELALLKNTQCP